MTARHHLICYDIADSRRLARIHRHLKQHALPLQYSVFLYHATASQLERRLGELGALMDPRADDIRAYPLPQRSLQLHLGPGALPADIHYAPMPAGWDSAPDEFDRLDDNDDDGDWSTSTSGWLIASNFSKYQ